MSLVGWLGIVAPATADPPEPTALYVIVHTDGLSAPIAAGDLELVFTLRRREWSYGKPIIPLNYPPNDKLRVAFDRAVLRMSPEEVSRYWIDRRIRDGTRPPRHVATPGTALRFVASVPGAIAYLPERPSDPRVRVVARIVDGRVLPPDPE